MSTSTVTPKMPIPTNVSRIGPALTVVIPTLNSARTLERCLASLRNQRGLDGEPFAVTIVVVDNHSTDDTRKIAAELADVFATSGPERCAQRNRGLALTTSEHVLFIDSDMVVGSTVCAEVVAALSNHECGGVVVPEESFGEGFWAACRGLEKRIAIGDPRTEAARGFSAKELRSHGAWNESLTAAEDWDLTDRIIAAGWRIKRTSSRILHDEGHPTLRSNFRKKRYYGQWMASYLHPRHEITETASWSPLQLFQTRILHRDTRRSRLSPLRILWQPRLLAPQPHLAVGLIALKVVDAVAIGAGVLTARRVSGTSGEATA